MRNTEHWNKPNALHSLLCLQSVAVLLTHTLWYCWKVTASNGLLVTIWVQCLLLQNAPKSTILVFLPFFSQCLEMLFNQRDTFWLLTKNTQKTKYIILESFSLVCNALFIYLFYKTNCWGKACFYLNSDETWFQIIFLESLCAVCAHLLSVNHATSQTAVHSQIKLRGWWTSLITYRKTNLLKTCNIWQKAKMCGMWTKKNLFCAKQ